jgi:hypothetical protein
MRGSREAKLLLSIMVLLWQELQLPYRASFLPADSGNLKRGIWGMSHYPPFINLFISESCWV